jgi:hypothetical protein
LDHLRLRIETLLVRVYPLAILILNLRLFIVLDMVDAKRLLQDFSSVEVVHGEHGRALILVHNKAETFGFARILVTGEVHVHNFAISDRMSIQYLNRKDMNVLREDSDYISFREFKVKSANKNVRRVFPQRPLVV